MKGGYCGAAVMRFSLEEVSIHELRAALSSCGLHPHHCFVRLLHRPLPQFSTTQHIAA